MGNLSVETIRPSEYERLYDLLWRSFDRHYQRDAWDYFRPFYENDPWMRDEFVRVIRDGDRLAAAVTIFDRPVWIEGRLLRMGGIGNVATYPDFRGRGLSGAILDDCTAFMKENGFDVSLLFAGPVPLYEKHGWMTLKAYSYLFSDLTPPAPHPGLACRPVSWSQEHLRVFSLHKEFVKNYNFPADRNIAYWNSYVRDFKDRGCGLVGVYRGDEMLAYAITDNNAKEQTVWLKELCWTTGDALPSVFAWLVEKLSASKIRLGASGRANPAVDYLKGISGTVAEDPLAGFMARNINARVDMASDRFAEKILHFHSDDF